MKRGVVVKRTGRLKCLTGYCSNGQCEGTKPKSASGKPMPTCKWWDTCPCKCHKELDEMFELADTERILVESDYVPDLGSFVPISTVLNDLADSIIKSNIESAETDSTHVAVVAGHTFAATATGRKSRGQLEYEVLEVCADWHNQVFDWDHCTPKDVAAEIGKRQTKEAPSTGAIAAVWERWVALEFCVLGKKPSHLEKFLTEPSVEILDKLKLTQRINKKRVKSKIKRGVRE